MKRIHFFCDVVHKNPENREELQHTRHLFVFVVRGEQAEQEENGDAPDKNQRFKSPGPYFKGKPRGNF
ncbi:MAG: hypothetical protein ACLFPX_02965 [Candidatus Omnitrophota bacterium]